MKDLRLLFPYIKKYKYKILIGFLVVTISNLCSTYIPRVVGESIDIISNKNFDSNIIFIKIVELLLLTFLSGFFMFLTRRTIIVASREIEYDLRNDLFNSIKLRNLSFFHRNPTGNLMAYTTNDIPAAREFLGPAIMYSANTITTFVFALYFMFTLNIEITLYSLIPLPLIAYFTYILGKKIHLNFKNVQEQYAILTSNAQESFSGLRIIKAFKRESYELNIFKQLSKKYLEKNLKLAKIEALFMPLLTILVGLSQIIVLFVGGIKIINNNATLGDLTQFFIYLELLIWPVAAIGWVTNLVQRGSASSKRLEDIIRNNDDFENYNSNNSINQINTLEFKNVNFSYNSFKQVLNNINFILKRGEVLGIVGPIGSGKSTIAHLLLRLYDNYDGNILIDNYDIKKLSIEELRKKIGLVQQDTFLFSDTILNNFKFANPKARIEEVIEISNLVKLTDEVMTFENGFDTLLGERGITLSGGQKQRVALARTILKNPDVLILDDSLSAVDTETEAYILKNLRSKLDNKITIIISHRLSAVKDADMILYLENGQIVENGTHSELIKLNGKYSKLYEIQKLEQEVEIS